MLFKKFMTWFLKNGGYMKYLLTEGKMKDKKKYIREKILILLAIEELSQGIEPSYLKDRWTIRVLDISLSYIIIFKSCSDCSIWVENSQELQLPSSSATFYASTSRHSTPLLRWHSTMPTTLLKTDTAVRNWQLSRDSQLACSMAMEETSL